jgi:hypothetical protein
MQWTGVTQRPKGRRSYFVPEDLLCSDEPFCQVIWKRTWKNSISGGTLPLAFSFKPTSSSRTQTLHVGSPTRWALHFHGHSRTVACASYLVGQMCGSGVEGASITAGPPLGG